jgi:hypothetical protein
MPRTIPSETKRAALGEGGVVLSDTDLIEMCEASIVERANDKRYGGKYMCIIGTLCIPLGSAQHKTFRELLSEAAVARMTKRLKGD